MKLFKKCFAIAGIGLCFLSVFVPKTYATAGSWSYSSNNKYQNTQQEFLLDSIIELLKYGINVPLYDEKFAEELLFRATECNDVEAVKILLKVPGIDLECKYKRELIRNLFCGYTKFDDRSPLFVAAEKGYTEIVKLLADAGAKLNPVNCLIENTPLHSAAGNGHIDIVKFLLDKGIDVNAKNKLGYDAVYFAHNNYQILKLLLEHGANVNSRDNICGSTILHVAANHNYDKSFETVELFLRYGAKVNIQDNYGSTPLHRAVNMENIKIVELLVNAGAKLDIQDVNGSTPLHRAVNMENIKIVELLVNAGASLTIKDKHGRTPGDYARQYGFTEIEKYLSECMVRGKAML